MLPTSTEVLRAARRLISKPANWTSHMAARALDGTATSSFAADAFSFCAIGACERAAFDLGDHASVAADRAADYLAFATPSGLVTHFNDSPRRQHADILAWFDRAIALAETAEASK